MQRIHIHRHQTQHKHTNTCFSIIINVVLVFASGTDICPTPKHVVINKVFLLWTWVKYVWPWPSGEDVTTFNDVFCAIVHALDAWSFLSRCLMKLFNKLFVFELYWRILYVMTLTAKRVCSISLGKKILCCVNTSNTTTIIRKKRQR